MEGGVIMRSICIAGGAPASQCECVSSCWPWQGLCLGQFALPFLSAAYLHPTGALYHPDKQPLIGHEGQHAGKL